jgi:hypothetical protein
MMDSERRDIGAALTQRREFNREEAQSIKKVLAKSTRIYLFLQVAIGRGNDADIDLATPRFPEALQFVLLQNA